jgi:hypothetical protein
MPDKIYTQAELEKRLLKKYYKKIDFIGLSTSLTPLEQAYELRNMDIAYVEQQIKEESIAR